MKQDDLKNSAATIPIRHFALLRKPIQQLKHAVENPPH
jgi:hypothetical protein